jgi:hypothetical protein
MATPSTTVFGAALALALTAGCATPPAVDDGRALDRALITRMQAFGEAAVALRPAIVRSAAAAGSGCEHQYELPFDVLTSYGVGDAAVRLAGQAASLMAQSAANRASLSGVSHVAAGVFGYADRWAFDAMRRLGRDPRAGLTLHGKLVAQGGADNAFLLDAPRLAALRALADGLH